MTGPESGTATDTASDAAAGPSRNPAIIGWIAVVIGCAAVAAWIRWSPLAIKLVPMPSMETAATAFYVILFAPLIALAGLLGLVTRTRTFAPGHALAGWVPGALAIGLAGLLFAVATAWLNGGLLPDEGPPVAGGMIAVGLALTLVQVGAEEVVFRGWLQALLGALAGPWVGLLLASVLFAAMHLLGGELPPHALANVFLAGVLFGLLAQSSGGIVAPIAAHFGWNALEDLGFGLIPNPGVGPFGAIHNVQIVGPTIWGGGTEGLNASIGTTIALVALILPLLALLRRRAIATGI